MNLRPIRIAVIAVASLAGVTCSGGGGGTPSTPTPVATSLQITCPTSKTAESITGEPVPVDFGTATAQGGTAPITVTCTPASSTNFALGTTTVTCTATDARQTTATCALPVAVSKPGLLTATRFMAFGDSITSGVLQPACPGGITTSALSRTFMLADARLIRAYENPAFSYPTVLQNLLASRYPDQSIVVVNEGVPGEFITDVTADAFGTNDATINRLRNRIGVNAPQVVLLQEGINDLNNNPLHPDVSIPAVIKGLHDATQAARQMGKQVFLATLLPERPGACRAYAPNSIAAANEQIRALAAADGVPLVDLSLAFEGVTGQYLGTDGLHPNDLGYQKIATTFFAVIREKLETPR